MIPEARMLILKASLALSLCFASSHGFLCGQVQSPNGFGIDGGHIEPAVIQPSSNRPQGIPGDLEAEWIAESEFGFRKLQAGLSVPLLFLKLDGSPPLIMRFGFNHTDLDFPDRFGLPNDLYEASFGLSGVQVLNDRWAVRSILGMDFATDGQNRSSDAWRFRGGAFAIYEVNPQLKLSFGAIALGREDLPVVPALGAVWQPNDRTRWDLILPRPKVSYLLTDNGSRQNWIYAGVGLEGNTWGYVSRLGLDRQLSYGDWRWTMGWQSRPSAPVGSPFVFGRKYSVEIGYAFSRDIELDQDLDEIGLPSSFLFRISTSY